MMANTKQTCSPLFIAFVLLALLSTIVAETAAAAASTNNDTAVNNNASTTATKTNFGSQCDETKCRAPMPGRDLFRGYCWAKESNMITEQNGLCAEGYKARETIDETKRPDFVKEGYTEFTCCPHSYNDTEAAPAVRRNCDSSACKNFGSDCVVPTNFGYIGIMICERNSRFAHPNFVALTDGNRLVYTCCETSDGTEETYKNAAFYQFLVSSTVLSAVVIIPLSVLIASILMSPKARSDSFNLYIVFVSIPDWIFNVGSVIINSIWLAGVEMPLETYNSKEYFLVGACSLVNIFISIIICYELHNMVMHTHRCERTNPPSRRRIYVQCGVAFGLAFGLQVVFFLTGAKQIYLGYTIVLLGFCSIGYILWAFCRMRKTGMLSIRGRSRFLALYFGRIILIFFGFWVPAMVIGAYRYLRAWNPYNNNWPWVAVTYLLTLQGAASFAMAMTKPDIYKAVTDLKDTTLGRISTRLSHRKVTDTKSFASGKTSSRVTISRSSEITSAREVIERDGNNETTIGQDPDGKGQAEAERELRSPDGDYSHQNDTSDPKLESSATESSRWEVSSSAFCDSKNDTGERDEETGAYCYESKQTRRGPIEVLTTGQIVSRTVARVQS